MDLKPGSLPQPNDQDLFQELELLRSEVTRLKGERDKAVQFEYKYHDAIQEINRLRNRLERLGEQTLTKTESKDGVANRHSNQLEISKASPLTEVVTKQGDNSFIVKREVSPIRVRYREFHPAIVRKQEKLEELPDMLTASFVKQKWDYEAMCISMDEDPTVDSLDLGTREGVNRTFGLSKDPPHYKASRVMAGEPEGDEATRVKREPSVVVISSDNDSQTTDHARANKVKSEPMDVEVFMGDKQTIPRKSIPVKYVKRALAVGSSLQNGKTLQEQTIKVKKEEEKPDIFVDEARFAPIQAILDSYPRAELSPTQLANSPVPRELISYAWGGGTQVVFATTGKEKRRENILAGRLMVEEYAGLSRIWNLRLPRQPGDHGVAYAVFETTEPQPLFVREAPCNWRYLGHYTFEGCPREFDGVPCPTEFNGELWDRLPQKTKRVWLNGFVNANWGYNTRLIVHLWRELGRDPTKEEIATFSGKCEVTEYEVDKALSDKHIHIGITIVKFHYYSDVHYNSIISRKKDYLVALHEGRNRSKGVSKAAGKKRKTSDSSQKARGYKKAKQTSVSEDEGQQEIGDSSEDYKPTMSTRRSARHQ